MERSSGRKTTFEKSDMTGANSGRNCLQETEYGERSELNAGECEFLTTNAGTRDYLLR